jgi:lipopolysaccharide transport system ATP-binding protein
MAEPAIKCVGLGKRYWINPTQTYIENPTFREALANSLSLLRARTHQPEHNLRGQKPFWAIKEVSFEVPRGQVVGIIGRNGAGKSTLLKILSRVIRPTEGYGEVRGRVGSLLEVGIGFHPDLTGRENTFLNGAVLGRSRRDVRERFNDIVDYAEIGEFIDTPVKRYSSGMYVRLAFSVAIHMEPDILILDEVLSVGDIGFQQKSLERIRQLIDGGRTVLFVSHSLTMIKNIANTVVWLERGKVRAIGDPLQIADDYEKQTNRAPELEATSF